MTLNYFEPNKLVQKDATFNYLAKTGIGFGITPDNEQVFITARMVEENKLAIGDSIRVWAVDNMASPETSHFPSRWRAVRVHVIARLEDIIGTAPAPIPAPTPVAAAPMLSDFTGVMDKLLAEPRPWTVNELTYAIAKASQPLSALPDLIQKVDTRLAAMHKNGDTACLKVYAKVDNDRASAVYYAKDVDVFYEHLDTPLEEK